MKANKQGDIHRHDGVTYVVGVSGKEEFLMRGGSGDIPSVGPNMPQWSNGIPDSR